MAMSMVTRDVTPFHLVLLACQDQSSQQEIRKVDKTGFIQGFPTNFAGRDLEFPGNVHSTNTKKKFIFFYIIIYLN